jgi:hypothetical protein
MAIYSGVKIDTSGLVLSLDASSSRSYTGTGNTWYDLSGNSNHASKVNSPSYFTIAGGGFTVDGVGTNYFDLDSKASLVNLSAGTVGGWVRFADLNTTSNNNVFVSYGGNAYGGGFLLQSAGLNGSSYRLEFATWGGSITGAPEAALNLADSAQYQNQDIYMIGTWTTSEIKLYINGVVRSTVSTNAALPSRSTLRINSEGGRARGINGHVYNCNIYDRALSASEIKNNFEATRDRYGI